MDKKLKGRNTTVIKRVRIVDFIIDEIMTSTSLKLHSKKAYNGLANKWIAFEKVIISISDISDS